MLKRTKNISVIVCCIKYFNLYKDLILTQLIKKHCFDCTHVSNSKLKKAKIINKFFYLFQNFAMFVEYFELT